MTLWQLALKSAWARRLTLSIILLAIVLSSAVLLAVERVRTDARASFTQSIAAVDLVVGARTGAVQLMLSAVFHRGNTSTNISFERYTELQQNPQVRFAIPINLGDTHDGFTVIGTTPDYFSFLHNRQQQALQFATGRAFGNQLDSIYEVVIGAHVAAAHDYHIGDTLTLAHGGDEPEPKEAAENLAVHADKPFKIVGILAPSGTPTDRALMISLAAMSAIHLDWAGGAPIPGFTITAEQARKFNLQPQSITAILVGLHDRAAVFGLQRQLNEFPTEALLAAIPALALDELWQTLAVIENVLRFIAALVVIIGLTGLSATLLAGLAERRRELAILRAVGASARDIWWLLILEGIGLTILGLLGGYALLTASGFLLGSAIQTQLGITLSHGWPSRGEWQWIGLILLTGIAASLLPGWQAWRLSLSDGLTPRY